MAQVQQQPPNASHPSTNGQPGPSPPNQSQPPPLSWEGDRMFNVYIHDYFVKRGFHKAAKELGIEADIGNDAFPPINARQGFLFEWWNVFWVFFSAKTTQQGPENVLLYIQWMQNQADRNRNADPSRMNQLGIPGQPRVMHRHGMPPNPMRAPGPLVNGVPMPPVGQSQPPIGAQGTPYPMSAIPPGPQQPQHQQPQPGPSQINGIIDPHNMNNTVGQSSQRPLSQQQSTRPGPPQQPLPPPSHPNAIPHLQPGQRPMTRPPGSGQFQSPTIAPAHPPGVSPHPSMGPPHMGMVPGGIPQNAPQLGQQHPSIMRNPPPQGGQPSVNTSPRGPAQTPAQQGFQHGGAPSAPSGSVGSRSNTPATTTIVNHRSPLMMPNESASPGHWIGDDTNRRLQMSTQGPRPPQNSAIPSHPQHPLPVSQQQQQQQQPSRPGTSQSFGNPELQHLEEELARIPPVFLASMKQHAGVPDVPYSELTDEQRASLYEGFKKTMLNFNGTVPGARGARATGMMPPPPQASQSRQQQQQQQQPPLLQSHQVPGAVQRGQKRTSTSPGDENQVDITPKDQSPPDRKRQRQSPQVGIPMPIGGDFHGNVAPMSQMSPLGGFPSGHPPNHLGTSYPGPGTPHFPNGVNFRPGPVGNPPIPGHPAPNASVMPMGSLNPNVGHAMPPGGMNPMNPALANQHNVHQVPGSQNLVMPQQQQQQQGPFRHPVTTGPHMHKMPGQMGNVPNQNVVPDQTIPPNRAQPQPNKSGSMMPPPPSPAHRPETLNVLKPTGMMPPPSQSTPSGPMNNNGPLKDQTAPSPARIDGSAPSSSPRTRPASRSGVGVSAPQSLTPSSQSAPVNPLTPAPSGTTGTNGGNTTSAPSPSPAAIGSLPRPQTSGPEGGSNTQANNSNNSTPATTTNGPPPPPPSLSTSVPPSTSAPLSADSIFTGFFDTMEDGFGLDGLELDPNDFSQWIEMNPIN